MQLSHVPRLSWAALVVAALGFVISLSITTTISVDGVERCSSFDFVPMLAGILSLVLAGAAYGERRRRHEKARLPMPWMHGITAIVVVVAIVHGLRAFGVLGGPC